MAQQIAGGWVMTGGVAIKLGYFSLAAVAIIFVSMMLLTVLHP
jgi:hypothetical protein